MTTIVDSSFHIDLSYISLFFSPDGDSKKVVPCRTDLSKSFAQLSLPTILELSSIVTDTIVIDKSDDLKATDSTSSLVVIAKTIIKAFTQFGPLQVKTMKNAHKYRLCFA